MFDDVLLLGKGGKTVYLGPTEDALKYFEELGFEVLLSPFSSCYHFFLPYYFL